MNEQITYVLDGALQFRLDGREIVVRSGEVLCIPPNMPHEALALEDTVDPGYFQSPARGLDQTRPTLTCAPLIASQASFAGGVGTPSSERGGWRSRQSRRIEHMH